MADKRKHRTPLHSDGSNPIVEKLMLVRDFIVAKSKFVFPVLLVGAVAITVCIALNVKGRTNDDGNASSTTQTAETQSSTETGIPVPDAPLELNKYPEVNTLIYTYYDALANGNAEAIEAISNVKLEDTERIRTQELGKYIEWYPSVEIYTKPGPVENSYIVFASTKVTFKGFEEEVPGFQTFYVCTDENGGLYLNEGEVAPEVVEYIKEILFQEDAVGLSNKITDEYNETQLANPDLFAYISEMEKEVQVTVGITLAEQQTPEAPAEGDQEQNPETPVQPETPVTQGPTTATATTTVNVRSSDSETADKIGKVTGGTKLEVLEQRANGWSKITFEGKDGYIKSEYLQMAESADGVQSIGSVTAAENVNVRASANETAEKLGVLAGGESVELVAREGDWCKIVYNGQVGYVKAEYVQ